MRSNSVTSASSTSSRATESASAPTKATPAAAPAAPVSESSEPQLQLSVKPVSGETFSLTLPSSTPLGTLRRLIALRTNLPESELRIMHGSRQLSSLAAPLSTLDLPSETTLEIALGGASDEKMATATAPATPSKPTAKPAATSASRRPRCNFKECSAAAQRIVGDCGFCAGHFCGKHRMLESHACPKLEACKAEEKERNREKLERERTVAIRGI